MHKLLSEAILISNYFYFSHTDVVPADQVFKMFVTFFYRKHFFNRKINSKKYWKCDAFAADMDSNGDIYARRNSTFFHIKD